VEGKKWNWKRSRWRMVVFLLCGLLLIAGIFYFYFNIYKVVPTFSEITYEYGDQISRDIEDYLSGTDWSVGMGELDLSMVDEAHTGTYQAVVHHGASSYLYSITIQDTVPPEIQWKEGPVYVAVSESFTVDQVVEAVVDVDSWVQTYFLREGMAFRELTFDYPGEYELEVVARDLAGNEARGKVSVLADTPPVIMGVHDFYMVPGSMPDYLADVTAEDDVDGDLTECIQVDDSEVEPDSEGVYQLRYLAKDNYGLETVENAQVIVASPEAIQEMIGRRQIDYRKETIIGAPNVYDAGASDIENLDAALQYMRPALVQLYHATGRGGYSSGSGYIMEITEDRIYICSNRHVVEKHDTWDIYFYDGSRVPGRSVGISSGYDVGVAEVMLEDVPEELLRRLMTVHIDKTYWESLDGQGIEMALERVDRTGGLLHVTKGHLIKIKQVFEWNEHRDHTEVTVQLVQGDSGSALLDGYGNLICMAYAFSSAVDSEPARYWCVPLDGILECYEEITGRVPYVY